MTGMGCFAAPNSQMRIVSALQRPNILSDALSGLAHLWPWGWLAALLVAVIAGVAPPLISAAAIAGLVVAVLLLHNPVWGAYALVLSVPVQKAVTYNAGPLEVTITQTLFVFVL